MAVEGKSLALLLVSYISFAEEIFSFEINSKPGCVNVQSLLRRGFCCESQVSLFEMSHRNKLLYSFTSQNC